MILSGANKFQFLQSLFFKKKNLLQYKLQRFSPGDFHPMQWNNVEH